MSRPMPLDDGSMAVLRAIDRQRREAGLSQRRLAEMVGTPQGHLSEILRGRVGPSLAMVERLAAAMDCHLAIMAGERQVLPMPPMALVVAHQKRLEKSLALLGRQVGEMAVDIGRVSER